MTTCLRAPGRRLGGVVLLSGLCFGKSTPALAVKADVERERKRSLCSRLLPRAVGMAASGSAYAVVRPERPLSQGPTPPAVTSDLYIDIQQGCMVWWWCILGTGWIFEREHGLGSPVIHWPWRGWGAGLVCPRCSRSASPFGGTRLFFNSATHKLWRKAFPSLDLYSGERNSLNTLIFQTWA